MFFRTDDQVRIRMPLAPSTNNLFINAPKGGSRARVRSPAYRQWAQLAGWEVRTQRPRPMKGRVTLQFFHGRPDKRRRDASNYIKAPEDLLVSLGIIEDDSLVEGCSSFWVPGQSGTVVWITPFETMWEHLCQRGEHTLILAP